MVGRATAVALLVGVGAATSCASDPGRGSEVAPCTEEISTGVETTEEHAEVLLAEGVGWILDPEWREGDFTLGEDGNDTINQVGEVICLNPETGSVEFTVGGYALNAAVEAIEIVNADE